MIDVFITYKNREKLFKKSFESFIENTDIRNVRLTIVCDGFGIPNFLNNYNIDHVLVHKENLGLGPSINQVLSHIKHLNFWYKNSPLKEDNKKESKFICYCQDDLLYQKNWLIDLMRFFSLYEFVHNLGFASGVECIEHKKTKIISTKLPNGIRDLVLKKWIRAANMFGRTDYWLSMLPIPSLDPETGIKRAKPNNGIGSGVDWHFVRNHENSIVKTNKNCLVLSGLLKHIGYNDSTWFNKELPEHKEDKL